MRFADVTRGGNLAATLDGINAALENELRPVKLNAVLRRSSWQQDVPQLLLFAGALGLEIRFIELMRTGTERVWCDSEFVSAAEIQTWLTRQGARISLETHSTGSACLSSVHGEGKRSRRLDHPTIASVLRVLRSDSDECQRTHLPLSHGWRENSDCGVDSDYGRNERADRYGSISVE